MLLLKPSEAFGESYLRRPLEREVRERKIAALKGGATTTTTTPGQALQRVG